jgi:hypothetical protein
LQNWGGIPHPKGMIAEKLPEVRHFFREMPSNRFEHFDIGKCFLQQRSMSAFRIDYRC